MSAMVEHRVPAVSRKRTRLKSETYAARTRVAGSGDKERRKAG